MKLVNQRRWNWREVAPWAALFGLSVTFVSAMSFVPGLPDNQGLAAWMSVFGAAVAAWWALKQGGDARSAEKRARQQKVEVARMAALQVRTTAQDFRRTMESNPQLNSHGFQRLYNPAAFTAAMTLVRTIPVTEIGDPELMKSSIALEAELSKAVGRLNAEADFAASHANPTCMDLAFLPSLEVGLFNSAANVERRAAQLAGDSQRF